MPSPSVAGCRGTQTAHDRRRSRKPLVAAVPRRAYIVTRRPERVGPRPLPSQARRLWGYLEDPTATDECTNCQYSSREDFFELLSTRIPISVPRRLIHSHGAGSHHCLLYDFSYMPVRHRSISAPVERPNTCVMFTSIPGRRSAGHEL